jgi:hypothetical protein
MRRLLSRTVAHLLSAHLRRRDGLEGLAQSFLKARLLLSARAQLLRRALADRIVRGELGREGVAALGHGLPRPLECRHRSLGRHRKRGLAFDSRAQPAGATPPLRLLPLHLLGEPALRAQLGRQLHLADGQRPLGGSLAPQLGAPLHPAHLLGRLVGLTRSQAQDRIGGVTSGVRIGDGDRGALQFLAGRLLGADSGGGRLREALPEPKLLEDPLFAPGGRLTQLSGGREQHAA